MPMQQEDKERTPAIILFSSNETGIVVDYLNTPYLKNDDKSMVCGA
jgi:hypothetical protein